MKVLLANPACREKICKNEEKYFVRAGSRWPFSTVKKTTDQPEYIPFPFFLAYTAAILEKKSHEVIVDDGVAVNETKADFSDKIKSKKPDILLFETTTPTIDHDIGLTEKIKEVSPKTVICLAGAHASVFPQEILKKHKTVDYVLLGEYEMNFAKLVEFLDKKKNPGKIDGIAFRNGDKIIINKQKLIADLNALPFPARHLFPSNDNSDPTVYWDGFCQYKPSIQMQASRGCPFQCNFCLWNQVLYQNGKYRSFSSKRIVDEMEESVNKYGAKEIYFDDDTFTANKKQVLEICEEIKKRNFKIYWSVMGDAMVSDEEMVKAMANAGCIGIKFGVESGSREILKNINKPVNLGKVKLFARWCSENKIKTHATFSFGLSGETKQTMKQTLDFAKDLDVDSVQFSITTPFPGTKYFEELKKEKSLVFEKWEDFDGSSTSVIKFENISEQYLTEFCRKASGRWLLNKIQKPVWLKRQLFNTFRQLKGQGFLFTIKRLGRGFSLIMTK